jgi:hypothetical protein
VNSLILCKRRKTPYAKSSANGVLIIDYLFTSLSKSSGKGAFIPLRYKRQESIGPVRLLDSFLLYGGFEVAPGETLYILRRDAGGKDV